MNIREVLENANITRDDKARRVLNTCPDKIADIPLTEIKDGVTIERLESLTVPVYQYGGQITIHGIFKDMPDDLRVAGYKSVFLNGNKSLGVKWVAVDGSKKTLLHDVSRYSKTKWSISIDSQGCMAIRGFTDRDKAIECYKSTPDDLYIGNKQAVSLMWGGYAVILHIGAIYNDNLWPLITALTGIESQAEYERLQAEEKVKWEADHIKYEAERKAKAEADKRKLTEALANFKVPSNWVEFDGKLTEPGTYAHITDTWSNGIALEVIKVAKRGGYICTNTRSFKDFVFKDWQPDTKYRKANWSIDGWQILDKPVKADVKPQSTPDTVTDITITHNDKLNGIEIKFPGKPSDSVINQLKEYGFRWSYKSMLWYNRYTVELWDKINTEFKIGVC